MYSNLLNIKIMQFKDHILNYKSENIMSQVKALIKDAETGNMDDDDATDTLELEKAEKLKQQEEESRLFDLMLPPEPPKPIPRPKSILPPPDWKPTPLKIQGKIHIDEYIDKVNKVDALEKEKLKSQRKRLLKLKRNDIKKHGAYKCTISQCNQRFFSKSKQIEHTTQHQRMFNVYINAYYILYNIQI